MVTGARLLRDQLPPASLRDDENGDWLSLKPPPACPPVLRPLWPRARLACARGHAGRVAWAEGFHIVEARGAVATCAAPAGAALGLGDLDIRCRQLVEKARRNRG